MIEKIMTIWNELPQQTQLLLFDISKLSLLMMITLICIKKLKNWLILTGLDDCFKLSPLKKEKTTTTTWMSTGLANGLCLSLAVIVNDKFILKEDFLSINQDEILIKFWGAFLFYLLLMCLLKKTLVALGELLKNPAIEDYVEKKLGGIEDNKPYKQMEPLVTRIIHYATSTIYFSFSWAFGFMLVIDVFNLQLLSGLTMSFLMSSGNLLIALLMLFLGFKFSSHQRTYGKASLLHQKESILMMASCILLGFLIIGGSSSIFSLLPWLLLFVMLGYFLIKYEVSSFSDLVAGIFLRLKQGNSTDSDIENNADNHLHITNLGIFVSEASDSSGKVRKFHNSTLLSINAEPILHAVTDADL
jgi:hypothetical protein